MRNIAIIGAGQSGLLLGIGLVDRGYRVTLVADRTPEEIREGPVPAGATVFHDALEIERAMGLSLWDDVAVMVERAHIDVAAPDGTVALSIDARLDNPGLCIDQRLKSALWIEAFVRRGGRFVVKPATVSDLETYAREHDLVVVAAGRGEISHLFPRDAARSPFEAAARHVSMVVIRGIPERAGVKLDGVRFRILPQVGEIFSAPIYTKDLFQGLFLGYEAIPFGPMDRIVRGMPPEAQLSLSKEVFRDLVPWEYEAIRDAELADDQACLVGTIVPTVRRPYGVLPSGAVVMGIADTVNLHDPMAAQGANSAAKMALLVRERIVQHGDRPFDAEWMQAVFEEAWVYLQHCNLLGQTLLLPPEPHVMEILGAAAHNPIIASRLVNGFNHPPSLFPWLADPAEAQRFLASAVLKAKVQR